MSRYDEPEEGWFQNKDTVRNIFWQTLKVEDNVQCICMLLYL